MIPCGMDASREAAAHRLRRTEATAVQVLPRHLARPVDMAEVEIRILKSRLDELYDLNRAQEARIDCLRADLEKYTRGEA